MKWVPTAKHFLFASNHTEIATSQPSVVSFGSIYQDMQQSDHFEYEYHAMLLHSVPPLVPQHPSTSSRVGVIPSSIKRTPLIPATHETTTLTHTLEPNHTTNKETHLSVFSGPRYLPEKYTIKPLTTFRQSYFTPHYKSDPPSRYYVSPHVNQYFQAALQDGSYFESYSDYRPQDPVNFRHAYSLQQPRNSRKCFSPFILCSHYNVLMFIVRSG